MIVSEKKNPKLFENTEIWPQKRNFSTAMSFYYLGAGGILIAFIAN